LFIQLFVWATCGYKRYSQKHKIVPQEKFCNHYPPWREARVCGEKIVRFMDYDDGEMRQYEYGLLEDDYLHAGHRERDQSYVPLAGTAILNYGCTASV
jgi:hypothetical protein